MAYKKFILLLFAQCILAFTYSQTLKVPYQFGFEEGDPELSNWQLNVGDRGKLCTDQWMIGNMEHNEGYQSLYISCDGGATSQYGNKPNVVVASRTIELPTGNYDVSFDWKVWGEDIVSELYVCAYPADYTIDGEALVSNDTIGMFPKTFGHFIQTITTTETQTQSLSGSTVWTNASFPLSVIQGRKVCLAFVWTNENQDSTLASPLGACIDNIQITSAKCPKPENLISNASCGILSFSWNGFAPEYECGYRPLGSKYWNNEYNIDGDVDNPSMTWDGVEEGAYDVRVRAIDGQDTSAYVYLNTVVVWCPDNHCFDFVSLDNKEIVTCEAGAAIMYPMEDSTEYSFVQVPPIDFGSNNIYSRHTTNWVQGEFDPRTGNRLRTIPEDELASVRLGNWNNGAEAERITYNFEVLDDVILLMKYAVVLENPGHGEFFDPYFGLEIIKEDGTSISKDATCGEAFFSPQSPTIKWEKTGNFVWKDWTTIGIDLRECKGQKIKIQLTTQDCTPGAHGGYAYFTLDCIDATIKSDGCENITLKAPSGFRYLWYSKTNKEFKTSTEQSITVSAGDTTTYYCDVNYLDNDNCTFTLSSSVLPHNPMAEFKYSWEPENCNNIVKFENMSYVYANVNGVDSIIQGERCAHYLWEFDFNGETTQTDLVNPRYVMPNEGGKLKIKLVAYLEDEVCQNIKELEINVAKIHEHNITINKELCFGDYVILGDNFIMDSGTFIDTVPNRWGCDSITTMHVYVRPKIEDVIFYDTLCSIEPYEIGGYKFDSAGIYEVPLRTNDSLQCDSIVILHLAKSTPIGITVHNADTLFTCADYPTLNINFDLVENTRQPFEYSLIFNDIAFSAGFKNVDRIAVDLSSKQFEITLPDSCRPNHYEATLIIKDTISSCGDLIFPIYFDVYYASSILETKFDNLITILNSSYNGGYEFDSYQWYKNDKPIDGETNTYYYLSEGEKFIAGDCYYLVTKRKDDGVVMRTCEICPGSVDVDDIHLTSPFLHATVFPVGKPIVIDNFNEGFVNIYSLSGQLINSTTIDNLHAPMQAGVYLLQMFTPTETFITKIVVK